MNMSEKYNQVFESVKQMEIDGKELYVEELARTESIGLKKY